ncbi:unnamed protein product, partial [Phaeothamnion confervicola]
LKRQEGKNSGRDSPTTTTMSRQQDAEDPEDYAASVARHAKFLNMDPVRDVEYLWLAEEALNAELPEGWVNGEGEGEYEGLVYYYNEKTEESTWEHPLDDFYRQKFLQLKKSGKGRKSTRDKDEGASGHRSGTNAGGSSSSGGTGRSGGGQRRRGADDGDDSADDDDRRAGHHSRSGSGRLRDDPADDLEEIRGKSGSSGRHDRDSDAGGGEKVESRKQQTGGGRGGAVERPPTDSIEEFDLGEETWDEERDGGRADSEKKAPDISNRNGRSGGDSVSNTTPTSRRASASSKAGGGHGIGGGGGIPEGDEEDDDEWDGPVSPPLVDRGDSGSGSSKGLSPLAGFAGDNGRATEREPVAAVAATTLSSSAALAARQREEMLSAELKETKSQMRYEQRRADVLKAEKEAAERQLERLAVSLADEQAKNAGNISEAELARRVTGAEEAATAAATRAVAAEWGARLAQEKAKVDGRVREAEGKAAAAAA